MAGVMCPRCGAVSPSEAKACPACGSSLHWGAERTGRHPSRELAAAAGPEERRTVDDGATTAPDDTIADEELQRRAAPVTPRAAQVSSRRQTGPRPALGVGPTPTSGSKDLLIGRKLQEYVVERRLGVGGMGVVYKAVQPMIGKHVAIKVLRPDVVPEARDIDRLLEEARVVSSIKHRGIINIFGAGTLEDGRHYLIMELLEGESLEQLMTREGSVPAEDAVVILEQTLSALVAAHEAGIVHRDLKPANIFIAKEQNQLYVKLLDFGLARRHSQDVTRIAGTPDYISPEHARGRAAGPPADMYAFGVLCFHMLTGRLPFLGTSPMEVMEQQVHSPPPVPHEIAKNIPKALSELILQLLAKEPGERPDAGQVRADLRAATRQLRNASTQRSLMAVEPVSARDAKTEAQRARVLARNAQLADVRRTVNRRWPLVVAGVVVAWLVGVGVYVLAPSTPQAAAVAPSDINPIAFERVAPTPSPGKPEVIEVVPDRDAPMGEAKLAQLAGERGVYEQLAKIDAALKREPRLRKQFRQQTTEARVTCRTAKTLRQFGECCDQVDVLFMQLGGTPKP